MPPSIRITFELEAAPPVVADFPTVAQETRLRDWLDGPDDRWLVVANTVLLAERDRGGEH